MAKSVYLPFWVSLGTIAFSMLPALAIEELHGHSGSRSSSPHYRIGDADPVSTSDPILGDPPSPVSTSVQRRPLIDRHTPTRDSDENDDEDGSVQVRRDRPKHSFIIIDFTCGILSVFHSRPLALCILIFYLKSVAMASEGLIFQYESEKFGWALRETTWLRVALASSATLVTLIIGPLTSSTVLAMRRLRGNNDRGGAMVHKLDLNLTRISLCTLTVFMLSAWCSRSGLGFLLCMCLNTFYITHHVPVIC